MDGGGLFFFYLFFFISHRIRIVMVVALREEAAVLLIAAAATLPRAHVQRAAARDEHEAVRHGLALQRNHVARPGGSVLF